MEYSGDEVQLLYTLLVIADIQCLSGATGDEIAVAGNSRKKQTSLQITAGIRPTGAACELAKSFQNSAGAFPKQNTISVGKIDLAPILA